MLVAMTTFHVLEKEYPMNKSNTHLLRDNFGGITLGTSISS